MTRTVSALLAATSGIVALIATTAVMHALTAQPAKPAAVTDAQLCLGEGWKHPAGPKRDRVIYDCRLLLKVVE